MSWPGVQPGRCDAGGLASLADWHVEGLVRHLPAAVQTVLALEPQVNAWSEDVARREKLKSNMQVVRARGGPLYAFADADTHVDSGPGVQVIRMPEHYGALSHILQVVPL